MITTHPRLFWLLITLLLFLALVCAWLLPLPLHAAAPPSLRVFTTNNLGRADLVPGDLLEVVIELRSDDRYQATLSHGAPEGLVLERASASAGQIVKTPFVSWTGIVSATQPINIVLTYRVRSDAVAGDRIVRAQSQIGDRLLASSTLMRVCCVSAPPAERHDWRVRLPVVRR